MSTNPLAEFDPIDRPLLDLLFERVDESMLREIADADYGGDVEAHLAGLYRFAVGEIVVPIKWEPYEVLELIRWSEPEDPAWEPGATGERGHWMRLFSCTSLIRAAAEPGMAGYFNGEESTVIQLVDSAIELGNDVSSAAIRFLCWRLIDTALKEWDRTYFAFAILLLCVSLDRWTAEGSRHLISLARSGKEPISEMLRYCTKGEKWRTLVRRELLDSTAAHIQSDAELIQLARELIGNSGE